MKSNAIAKFEAARGADVRARFHFAAPAMTGGEAYDHEK
jgi:hypothetical protein